MAEITAEDTAAIEAKEKFARELEASKAVWLAKAEKDRAAKARKAEILAADQAAHHERRKRIANEHYKNILTRRRQELGELKSSLFKIKVAEKIKFLWVWLPGGAQQLEDNAKFRADEERLTNYILRPLSQVMDKNLITDVNLMKFTKDYPADVPAWVHAENKNLLNQLSF